jgi:hypothetical protein
VLIAVPITLSYVANTIAISLLLFLVVKEKLLGWAKALF